MTGIQIVPTEPFIDDHPDSSDKRHSIFDTVSDAWSAHIEEDGDYDAWVTTQGPAGVTVPEEHDGETVLPDTTQSDRLDSAEEYLLNNESDLMDGADAVLIVDYWGGGGPGLAQDIGSAGDASNFTAHLDTEFEATGELPPVADDFGSEGIGFHELLHLHAGEHSEASTFDHSTTEYSAIWSPASDTLGCQDRGDGDVQVTETSDCTTEDVQGYMEANGLD